MRFTVYPRGKIYYVDYVFRDNDKVVKRSTGVKIDEPRARFLAEKKAMEIYENELSQKVTGANSSRLLLSEAVEKTYEQKWSRNKDSETPIERMSVIQDILGDVYLDEIDSATITELQQTLFKRGIKVSTVNRYMSALRTVLNLAMRQWGVLDRVPHIQQFTEPKGRIRYLEIEEEEALLNYVRGYGQPDYADLFATLIDTGFRFSELNCLKWDNVKFDQGMIHCWQNKGNRPRTVPMTDRVHQILLARHQAGKEDPFNLSYDYARYLFRRAQKSMGLEHDKDFCIHALRHTYASRLVQNEVSLYVVKELLGHSSVTVTEKYAHLNDKSLREAVEVLNGQRK